MSKITALAITAAAQKLAEEEGVDLSEVEPTGADGGIIIDDVRAAIEARDADADKTASEAAESSIPVPMPQADTQHEAVPIETVTTAATVGPKTDRMIRTRLDEGEADAPEASGEATASGDLIEVFSPNRQFAGVRAGVSFAGGRGLATAKQAARLVREFGYRAPALG
jgi:hypothetical protein